MTRRAAQVLLLALALVLSGCVSVPTEGPVVEGRPAGDPLPPPNVAVIPTGPRPGDAPVAVVEGFLASMSSYEPGYLTARQFLTPDASAQWAPESGISIYGAGEGSRNVSATEDGVTISLRLQGRVDADGTYTPAEADARLVLDLTLAQVDGEWRIATPPDGLVMTAFDFTREYAAYASYFFDPQFEVLVPDLTYLPVRGNLPTLLVEELLDGASGWLDPAVRSALDPGVRLTSGSVVQVGTVARVDLTDQVAAAPAEQRDRLAAQLAWTLRQAPGVSEVAVLADGRPVPLPSSPTGVVSADAYAFYDPATVPAGDRLFAIDDDRVVEVVDAGTAPVAGPLGASLPVGGAATPFRSVGVNLTATRAAAVSADGSSVTVSGLTSESIAATYAVGADIAVPSFDRSGRVWLVDRAAEGSRVLVLDEDEPVEVDAGVLGQVRVERLTVAPDGVRVAGVYTADGARRLLLALLRTPAVGDPEIVNVRDVPLEGLEPFDAAWASATALAVLADDGDAVAPYLVELSNASVSSRGQVERAVSLASAPGQALVIGTAPGAEADGDEPPELLRQDALQEWVPIVTAQAPTYPG
jgi:hypothetical protein